MMEKRFFSLLLIPLALLVSCIFTACGDDDPSASSGLADDEDVSPTPADDDDDNNNNNDDNDDDNDNDTCDRGNLDLPCYRDNGRLFGIALGQWSMILYQGKWREIHGGANYYTTGTVIDDQTAVLGNQPTALVEMWHDNDFIDLDFPFASGPTSIVFFDRQHGHVLGKDSSTYEDGQWSARFDYLANADFLALNDAVYLLYTGNYCLNHWDGASSQELICNVDHPEPALQEELIHILEYNTLDDIWVYQDNCDSVTEEPCAHLCHYNGLEWDYIYPVAVPAQAMTHSFEIHFLNSFLGFAIVSFRDPYRGSAEYNETLFYSYESGAWTQIELPAAPPEPGPCDWPDSCLDLSVIDENEYWLTCRRNNPESSGKGDFSYYFLQMKNGQPYFWSTEGTEPYQGLELITVGGS